MLARLLLDRSVPLYGEPTMAVAYRTFPEAWEIIALGCGNNLDGIDAARLALAEAILAVVHDSSEDADQLKSLALHMLRLPK